MFAIELKIITNVLDWLGKVGWYWRGLCQWLEKNQKKSNQIVLFLFS